MSCRTLRLLALVVFGTLVTLHGAAWLVRLEFVLRSGPLAATTGFEEFSLYNIWKVVHGCALYEWPQKDRFLLTSYNAGFYHVYAAWARLWGADGAGLVTTARLLTAASALAGMSVQAGLLRRFAPSAPRGWIWALSFLTWFGTTFSGWSTLTARPDIPAAALALGGFALALRGLERRQTALLLGASLLFFAAWSFKQSVVWIFAGTLLHVIFRAGDRGRPLAALAGPFTVLTLLLLAGGGDAYRYNLFTVPAAIYRWFPRQSALLLGQIVALNLFFWGLAAWALARGWRRWPEGERLLAVVALPPVAVGVAQLALHGSSTNNLLEGFLLVALLGSAVWLRVWTAEATPRRLALGVVLAATMIPLPAAQLVLTARGTTYATLRGVSIGNLAKLTPAQLAQRRRFSAWIQTLPQPVWTRDAMLQLPWFANGNRFPAFPLDVQFEADARRRGLLDEGFASWIRRREFACLLLRPGDRLFAVARRSGYREATLPDGFGPLLATEFGLDRPALLLLVRDGAVSPDASGVAGGAATLDKLRHE